MATSFANEIESCASTCGWFLALGIALVRLGVPAATSDWISSSTAAP